MADNISGGAHILCLRCRSTFTDEQVEGHHGCPTCGSKSVPGDTREQATLTYTHHEWRILFMWADNWAGHCDRTGSTDAAGAMQALMREAKRQVPTLPGLSLMEEVQEVANQFGRVTMHGGGEETVIEPEKKH